MLLSSFEWFSFFVINWVIALCYFFVPFRIWKQRLLMPDYYNVGATAFLVVCGVHHLAHPYCMYVNQYGLLLAIDIATAVISLAAAILFWSLARRD